MTVTRETVLAALKRVPEPCSIAMRAPIDICEMGLVEDVQIACGRVRVELVLTDPSCGHFASMRRYIADVLTELDGVDAVDVVLSTATLWTPDRTIRA
jgi:metal-sulfur cluster biosynthetic enzyme